MDADDLCQATPAGESVYSNGCSDSQIDSDGDGISDAEDICPSFNDAIDLDFDLIPDGCDEIVDSDGDGVADEFDVCPGHDDSIDVDLDLLPDDCDNSIDDEIEVKNEQSSSMSGEIRALAIISVLVLISLILIVLIRRGKPPTNEENHSFSGKQYPKF